MRIESVILRDVGPFKDARIDFPKGSDDTLADVYLLTGPNGCGKSTVLYAIAAAIGGPRAVLGSDGLATRLRSSAAEARVEVDDGAVVIEHEMRSAEGSVSRTGRSAAHWGHRTPLQFYRSTPSTRVAAYADKAEMLAQRRNPAPFDWCAFAYAGTRSLSTVDVVAVAELTTSPFDRSLSFTETADSSQLVHWIAGQQFKRLKAKDAGNSARAEQIEQSIRDIERVIGEIVDDPGFLFVSGIDDNNVRVRHRGEVVEMGVLPDGLKSIVAWVADLLMRLDRIPWVDNTPTLQRSFLLLLDEIDIHLHPAWQRKVLPIVQRMFPNAQIIASTHSPFVVASAADAQIISLGVVNGAASVVSTAPSQMGHSYGAVLRSIFGIEAEFDVETEKELDVLRDARGRALAGDLTARREVDEIAGRLASRSEELKEIVAFEVRQLDRQLAQRRAP